MSAFVDLFKRTSPEDAARLRPSLLERAREELEQDTEGFFRSLRGVDLKELKQRVAKSIGSGAEGDQRETWRNATNNQVVQPLQYFKPTSLQELRSIIRTAEAHSVRVRAIGSGHSFSDVCQTTDFLIDCHGLNGVIPLDNSLLKPGTNTAELYHVESGISIRELNSRLDREGLALANMGGYDAQTIIGATSTSTHGSGISLGPLSDSIVSLVLVSDGGLVYRIESGDGMTDPDAYKARYPNNVLVQDDDWFNTVIVSMGCTGVVYSVIIRVMPKYWLKEVRTISTWSVEKERLRDGRVLQENRHYEVYVNPYRVDGENQCLITTRNIVAEPGDLPFDKEHRNILTSMLAAVPGIEYLFDFVFDTFPELTPQILNASLRGLADDSYINVSYKVLNIGTANDISAYSAEVGFPIAADRHLAAADRILAEAEKSRELGNVYHTSPISLRFVKQSRAFLSMQTAYDTCMIEMPMIIGTQSGFETLSALENILLQYSGRPHWGQLNWLTGSHDLLQSMYPAYNTWLRVYRQLNAKGTFDNQFSDRVGFSRKKFVASRG